ncbi:MAG TPA: GMC family oxidoreductase, partial [Parvularculaceae bacterium]|nr:GMC family oxidoreductase [Parvularculaceae bacterium]
LGKAVAAQNIGRVRIASDVIEGAVPALGMHCHHMGTTRMSATPKYGVVDGDCKVHGIENLYIGGSSVYPTGGGCNPTFTIVCLSLRLGDHLANRLQRI